MSKDRPSRSNELDENKTRTRSPDKGERESQQGDSSADRNNPLASLQQTVGNRAVQRLLAQCSGDGNGPFELDDETAGRINKERGGGQALDTSTQQRMSSATGYDFNQVRVHTNPESDALNREIGAKAFTTGPDIYFRQGAYDPASTAGQELLAHEMTHVVQQGSGTVDGGGAMTVNAPGDAYEQEADAVAKAVTSASPPSAGIQRQEEDEDDRLQMQPSEEDEEDLLKQ
jgi:hypothetical protein